MEILLRFSYRTIKNGIPFSRSSDRIFILRYGWISCLSVMLKITAGWSLLRLTATIVAIFRCRPSPWGSGAMNVKVATKIKTQYFGPNSRFIWYYQYQLKWGSIDWFCCEHFFWFRHIATASTFLNGFGSFQKQSELQFDPNDVWSGWLIWLLPIRKWMLPKIAT